MNIILKQFYIWLAKCVQTFFQCVLLYRRAPVFGRHRFFGTSEHYGKAHGSLLSGWMNYNYTACCWFPTSNNILILLSQFWQIRFESYWLHCSKCRLLVLLRYYIVSTVFAGKKIKILKIKSKNHKNRAKTNKTKLSMCQKSGSNLFAVMGASIIMFLQFIIALTYVLYMSWKITEFEV